MKTAELQVISASDLATGDSDKEIAVPTGRNWRQLMVSISYVSSATVGNRLIEIQLRDASNVVLFSARASETQAASNTELYEGAINVVDQVVTATSIVHMILADFVMNGGFDIRAHDVNAIDPTGDDLLLRVHAMEQEYPRTLA